MIFIVVCPWLVYKKPELIKVPHWRGLIFEVEKRGILLKQI